MHVLHTFANNGTVPYLTWFTDRAVLEGTPHYTFILLVPQRPPMIEEMRAKGFDVIWIRYDDRRRKRGLIRALPLLWWHMRRIRPDIVHCNLFDDSLPGLIAARLAGIRRRVLTRQDTGYHWMHARRWVALDRWNNRMATHIIAISEENRRFIIDQEGADERKVTMVHNGIPPERFTRQDHEVMQRLRERFGLSSENLVFGSVARYVQWKGHRHVLDAAARIVSDHPNARFLLCGSGALRPSMEDLARSLGIASKVHFIDRIEPGEMPSFYGILDAFLHAAVMEPFGLVYAEAMMNAVPVVSTRTGAAADAIIDGVNGILIKDPTGEALALGVERLLALDRHAIGRMGRDTALRKYAFDVMWKGTMHVYQAAMSGV
ncbi:MAG TPA: glycosyltransferase family 4 protein [Flavobacteriales bacterium]|nr:glycosyltransferase family 4 protein [Flavobacteriales bacterium]